VSSYLLRPSSTISSYPPLPPSTVVSEEYPLPPSTVDSSSMSAPSSVALVVHQQHLSPASQPMTPMSSTLARTRPSWTCRF
jgi:hypothetical protein